MTAKLKVIHTSDWHLGHRLYNYDRTDEEKDFFEKLSKVVGEEKPDALLISGDIYHTCAPGNDVAKTFTDNLLKIQSSWPNIEIIVIAGNHDSYSRLEIDRSLWEKCNVHILGTPAENQDGMAIFSRNIITLKGKGIIAAVPFCHPRNFPHMGENTEDTTRDAQYFKGLRQAVCEANTENLPTVLMAHLAVGQETSFTGQEKASVIGGEECVDPQILGNGYDYVALGHIHCPQWVIKDGKKVARYCGTPRPIHFDETHPHAVDVVEIEAGKEPVLRSVCLTPMRTLHTVGGKDGLPFEDALKAVTELARETGSSNEVSDYLRINVKLKITTRKDDDGNIIGQDWESPGTDWNERARVHAEQCNMRFCLINFIREKAAGTVEGLENQPSITVKELIELDNEGILKLLKEASGISDDQVALIRGLMEEITAENRNQGGE